MKYWQTLACNEIRQSAGGIVCLSLCRTYLKRVSQIDESKGKWLIVMGGATVNKCSVVTAGAR